MFKIKRDLKILFSLCVYVCLGYLEQGLLLRDSKKLALSYLKSIQFKLDIVSTLPVELPMLPLVGFHPEFRFNRLVRINRLFECRLKIETRTTYPFLFRIVYLIVILVVIIHWNSCVYFLISKLIGIGSDEWVFTFDDEFDANLTLHVQQRFYYEYIYCFYWSTLMLTTIGEVNSPANTVESIVMIMNFLIAIVIVATLVGNISSVISNMNIQSDAFKQKVDAIKSLMKLRKVSYELDRRVIKWFDYLHNNCQTLDEQELLAHLPEKLGIEIASFVHMERLRNVNIFSDCEEGLLKELVTKLKLQVYSPGDYVCKKGDIGKEMYIIERGFLEVVSDDGAKVFVRLKPGAFFGEISILNIAGNKNGNRRTANVRSVGYSELLRLTKHDLWEVLADYAANRNMIVEKGKEKLRKDGLLEENDDADGKSTITPDLISYDLSQEEKDFMFAQLTFEDKLLYMESNCDELNKKLDTIINQFKETSAQVKERINNIKDVYNRKIGISV